MLRWLCFIRRPNEPSRTPKLATRCGDVDASSDAATIRSAWLFFGGHLCSRATAVRFDAGYRLVALTAAGRPDRYSMPQLSTEVGGRLTIFKEHPHGRSPDQHRTPARRH